MPREFCTLFDRHFLTRGLALYRSLQQHCTDFEIRILCMDEEVLRVLRNLELPRATLVPIGALEDTDSELAATRGGREPHEYCWTATPSLIRFALERSATGLVTYLDADMFFFSRPDPLYEELGDGSVLLIPHLYPPKDMPELGGIFNVGWVSFRADSIGLAALEWWRARCLEWCFDRREPGRFGDQRYLDDWPERFAPGVCVNRYAANALGPWNSLHHDVRAQGARILVDGRQLVTHHFSALRLFSAGPYGRAAAAISPSAVPTGKPASIVIRTPMRQRVAARAVYDRYAKALATAAAELDREPAARLPPLSALALAPRSVEVRLRRGQRRRR